MAQFYTLDEAADRLGMPVDDLKRKLKTDPSFTAIHPFRDGATLRFRAADIDELARSLGARPSRVSNSAPSARATRSTTTSFLPCRPKSPAPSRTCATTSRSLLRTMTTRATSSAPSAPRRAATRTCDST